MKKRLFSFMLTLCLMAVLLSQGVAYSQVAAAGWEGWTPISTQDQLMAIDDTPEGMKGKYYLTKDIVLTGEWKPIGSDSSGGGFCGIFDGNGHTISNVVITKDVDGYTGLFEYISTAYSYPTQYIGIVRNLNVEVKIDLTLEILSYGAQIGAIAGQNWDGKILNCTASGSIDVDTLGYLDLGGIVGSNSGTIMQCTSNVDLTHTDSGDIQNGKVLGGIAGSNSGTIDYCGNTGDIYAKAQCCDIGGIVGFSHKTRYIGCYNSGNLHGVNVVDDETYGDLSIGGIVGYSYKDNSFIRECFNTGSITSEGNYWNYVGGIVGQNQNADLSECYNTGAIKAVCRSTTASGGAYLFMGGLMGDGMDCAVTDSYNVGYLTISAYNGSNTYRFYCPYVGGLVGKADKVDFTRCFNKGYVGMGRVCPNYWIGGIVGWDTGRKTTPCTYTNTYWPYYGYMSGVDQKPANGTANTIGQLSTSAFSTQSKFVNFNFSAVWIMGDATPELRIQVPHVHTYRTLSARPATCTQTGLTASWYCAYCGLYFSNQMGSVIESSERTIPMIAHMPGAAVKEKESAGDCQTKATWESVVYCDLCKTHEFSRQPVAGDFGAHAP